MFELPLPGSTMTVRPPDLDLAFGSLSPLPTATLSADHIIYRPLSREELELRYRLTRREVEVAAQLALGRTNAEVARSLDISVHTVRRHVERVLMRLGVQRRGEVAAKLLGAG
jgi:DNA-binding CsgD family transcriptional regulator